jgi:predicted peroxiredoxin
VEKKKFIFVLSNATKNPMEVIGMLKIASNMKAFDDEVELDFFLIGEGVQLAKKGVAETISMELEGQQVNVGEMLEMVSEFDVKFFVCHAFMPGFGLTTENLIKNAEVKSSSYLGELLLEGRTPFSLSLM